MSREHEKGMSLIVKTITRLTVGVILLYGVYIVIHGHLTPGGGFAGGVIITLSFIHLMLAYGKDAALKRLSRPVSSLFESFGAVMFLAIALLFPVRPYFDPALISSLSLIRFHHHMKEVNLLQCFCALLNRIRV